MLLQSLAYTERLKKVFKKPLIKVKKYKKCASAPEILKSSMSAKSSGFLGQALFGENIKVRIFWSPDFKQTTVFSGEFSNIDADRNMWMNHNPSTLPIRLLGSHFEEALRNIISKNMYMLLFAFLVCHVLEIEFFRKYNNFESVNIV